MELNEVLPELNEKQLRRVLEYIQSNHLKSRKILIKEIKVKIREPQYSDFLKDAGVASLDGIYKIIQTLHEGKANKYKAAIKFYQDAYNFEIEYLNESHEVYIIDNEEDIFDKNVITIEANGKVKIRIDLNENELIKLQRDCISFYCFYWCGNKMKTGRLTIGKGWEKVDEFIFDEKVFKNGEVHCSENNLIINYHESKKLNNKQFASIFLNIEDFDTKKHTILIGNILTIDEMFRPVSSLLYLKKIETEIDERKILKEKPIDTESLEFIKYLLFDKYLKGVITNKIIENNNTALGEWDFKFNAWKKFKDEISGNTYIGFYIKTVENSLERFTCKIEQDGSAILGVAGATYHGHITFIETTGILVGDFEYKEKWEISRFRFLIKYPSTTPSGWLWGHLSGKESGDNMIISSRIALKKITLEDKKTIQTNPESIELYNPVSIALNNLDGINFIFDEDKELGSFFLAEIQPNLTEFLAINKLLDNRKSASNRTNSIIGRYRGLYESYSLMRNNINGKIAYYIAKYPILIQSNGDVKILDDGVMNNGKATIVSNTLSITFDLTFGVHMLFSISDKLQSHCYGTSARKRNTFPEARAEVMYKLECLDGDYEAKFNTLKYEEILIDENGTDENYVALKNDEKRKGLVDYLSGRINRLIFFNSTAQPDKKIQPRQEQFRRIYFYESIGLARNGEISEALKSLWIAKSHGFCDKDVEKVQNKMSDLELLKKEMNLEPFISNSEILQKIKELWGIHLGNNI